MIMMQAAVCAGGVSVALVELDENARMFEIRASSWSHCEVVLSLPAAPALDARIGRSTSTVGHLLLAGASIGTEAGFGHEDEKRRALSAQRAAHFDQGDYCRRSWAKILRTVEDTTLCERSGEAASCLVARYNEVEKGENREMVE